MVDTLLQYPTRKEVPAQKLVHAVKKALDDQWDRLKFGMMIDQVRAYTLYTPL